MSVKTGADSWCHSGGTRFIASVFGRVAFVAAALCAATGAAYADATIANNLTLTADADWRADGVVTVPEGVTVDLNGHTLWVAGLAGEGTFTSSVAASSTFDLTTAQTDASRVKSYTGGTDQALGSEFSFTIQQPWKLFADYAEYNSNQRAITAFNNGETDPIDIVYEFDSATAVNSYKLQVTSAGTYLYRAPKTWKFFGSATGADGTWVELDSQTNVTDWASYELRQFTFFNDTAYTYYRLRIYENVNGGNRNGDHLEFFKLEYGRVQNQIRLDLSQCAGFAGATIPATGTAKYVVIGGTASANADLRGLGKVTLEGTLDLNGCVVRATALDGKGKVTSSFSDSAAFDLTTTQTDDTYVKSYFGDSTTPVAFNTDEAWKAFADYAKYTSTGTIRQRVIDTTENFPKRIVYDFQTPTFIDTFKLMLGSANSASSRAPKDISFDGSDDGTAWTELGSWTETGWSASEERTFSFANEKAYRYYRISFATNNGGGNVVEFFRLQYGRGNRNSFIVDLDGLDASDFTNISTAGTGHLSAGDGVLSGDLDMTTGGKSKFSRIDGTIDLNGTNSLVVAALSGVGTITDSAEFDLTDADATRVTTPNTFITSGSATGPAHAAFGNHDSYDAYAGHRVIANLAANADTMPIRIDYDFREATVVNAYRLTVGGNSSSNPSTRNTLKARAPKSFSFWGSNEGGDGEWTKLDERTNETGWFIEQTYQEERQYEFANETPYRHYRIAFHENNGGDHLEFFKLEYGNTGLAGRLRVVVPSGTTVESATVALSGNLRLVKEGAGTLVMTKTVDYACGTEAAAGTLKCGNEGWNMPFGAWGRDVIVRTGAVLEMNARYNFYNYGFALDGGTLQNSTANVAETNPQIKRLRLMQDSTLKIAANYGIIGNDSAPTTVYLNGHTLEVPITAGKYFRCYNTTFLDGTVDIPSGGWLVVAGTSGVTATNVDFKVKCALYVADPFRVRGYEAKFYSAVSNGESNQLTVAGTFLPATNCYYGCTMLAGSTMDLTAWPATAGWPMVSGFGANGKTDLEFADSGEIAVNLAGRADLRAIARSADPHLFTWPLEDGVPVVPGAEFTLDSATAAAGYRVKKDATGLRLVYTKGMLVIVR